MYVMFLFVSGFLVFLVLVITYILYMSRNFSAFEKLGILCEKPSLAIGNMPLIFKHGIVGFHHYLYKKYANEKVYGFHEPGRAVVMVRDLDLIRDICIKNFNSFVNHRNLIDGDPFSNMLTHLKGNQWRRVRTTMTPTFTSGKLKRMAPHIELTTHNLLKNLREIIETGEPLELKQLLSCFTMDVIAGSGFGVEVNSLKDKKNPFVTEATKLSNIDDLMLGIMLLFPFMSHVFSKLGIGMYSKEPARFFYNFVDDVMANRREERQSSNARQDFVQLLVQSDSTTSESVNEHLEARQLTKQEIKAQSLIFILAGYDTTSTAFSFCLFLLAHHPECCEKAQEEVDRVLAGRTPNYDSAQELTYLEMCVNEALRMFPPGFAIDRVCNEDCVIDGIRFSKGMAVMFPVISIHYDPNIWEEPETFDPERFSESNKTNRHPFAHMPFGQGPRSCIGMRLALLEMKIGLAAILQEMTPVPCEKSVYPVKLDFYKFKALDGLWVKMVPRNK